MKIDLSDKNINSNPLNLKKNKIFIIAEAACNHMCSIDLAKTMIDSAKSAGVDAIKFQTYKSERLVTNSAPAYWGDETMKQTEYYKKLDKFEKNDYKCLFDYANEKNIIPFSTPFSIEDADMLHSLDMQIFKIPSFEIINLDLLKRIALYKKPIIMSTGAATDAEIDNAINVILSTGNNSLILMACTLSYPTKFEDANLLRIKTLKEKYPEFMIGMSDHTYPDNHMVIPAISVALGARVIEKHFTMSKTLTGSGHFFSLEPKDLTKMTENIRLYEKSLGDGLLGTADSEKKAKDGGRKSIVATNDLICGSIINKNNLTFKRPGNGISPDKVDKLIGKKLLMNISKDSQISWEDIE